VASIETIKPGDHLTPSDPPKCCGQPMWVGRGVCGLLYECVDCEDGIYVDSTGRASQIMRSAS
jgi:hypothetical protein